MPEPHQDRMVRHGLSLLLVTNIANLANILFQALTGRLLSVAEYGVMGAMMNLLLIMTTPLDALRTAVAHGTALAGLEGREETIRPLLRLWVQRLAWIAALGLLLGWVLGPHLAHFLHLPSTAPVQATAVALAVMLFSPLLVGVFQGGQRFAWMSAALSGWSFLRLGAAYLLLTTVAATATLAIWAHALGIGLALGLCCLGLRRLPPSSHAAVHIDRGPYFLPSLWMLTGYAVLMNADLLLVKHYLTEDLAGHFARAAVIGRAVIFLPLPITHAMFPKVASSGDRHERHRATLVKAVALVGLLIGCSVALISCLPGLPLRILFNDRNPSAEDLQLVRWVMWALSPLGLTFVLMNFELAQRRFAAMPFLWILAAAYAAGVKVWHESLGQVVLVLGISTTLSAIGMICFAARSGGRGPAPQMAPIG